MGLSVQTCAFCIERPQSSDRPQLVKLWYGQRSFTLAINFWTGRGWPSSWQCRKYLTSIPLAGVGDESLRGGGTGPEWEVPGPEWEIVDRYGVSADRWADDP
jgi:hypothetical protein